MPEKMCAKKIFAISQTSHLFLSIFGSKSNELALTDKFVAFLSFPLTVGFFCGRNKKNALNYL
jgi:hypothetical protein